MKIWIKAEPSGTVGVWLAKYSLRDPSATINPWRDPIGPVQLHRTVDQALRAAQSAAETAARTEQDLVEWRKQVVVREVEIP